MKIRGLVADFWDVEIHPRTVNFFLRVFGLMALLNISFSFPHRLSFYHGPEGILFTATMPQSIASWSFLPYLSEGGLTLFYWLTCAALVILMTCRLVGPCLLICWLWHIHVLRLSPYTVWATDYLLLTFNFALFFFPRKSVRSPPANALQGQFNPNSALGLRYMQIYLSALYFYSALGKLHVSWLSGKGVQSFFSSWQAAFPLVAPSGLVAALGVSTVAVELFLCVAIWMPRLRGLGLVISIGFHGSIFVLSHIKVFSLIMLMCQTFYFYRPIDHWLSRKLDSEPICG